MGTLEYPASQSFMSMTDRVLLLSWAGWLHKCPPYIMKCPMATTQTMVLSDCESLRVCLIPPMSRFGWVLDTSWGGAGWSLGRMIGVWERGKQRPQCPYHFCPQGLSGNTMLGVGHVVTTSIGMCDIDIRPVRPKAWQRGVGLTWRKGRVVSQRLTLLPAPRVSTAVSLSLAGTLCFRASQTGLIGNCPRRHHQ